MRDQAAVALNQFLSTEKSSTQKLVLLHTDHCLHGHEDMLTESTPRAQATDSMQKLNKKSKEELHLRLQRSVKDLCKCVVEEVSKTGSFPGFIIL